MVKSVRLLIARGGAAVFQRIDQVVERGLGPVTVAGRGLGGATFVGCHGRCGCRRECWLIRRQLLPARDCIGRSAHELRDSRSSL